VSDSARERAAAKIARLASQPGDLVTFWRSCTEVIAGVVPYYWTPCWFTLDPASLLITSHFHEGMPRIPAEWLAEEYYGDDVNQLADVARSDTGLCTLHEATGGDPSGSPRWQRNMQLGGDQELIARLRARSGEVWGALGLYREPGQPSFDDADKYFLRAVAPQLAEGARRALLVGEATDPEGPGAPEPDLSGRCGTVRCRVCVGIGAGLSQPSRSVRIVPEATPLSARTSFAPQPRVDHPDVAATGAHATYV
jgi:hypothetical protein